MSAPRKGGGDEPSDLITPEGLRKLEAEVDVLWKEERPRIAKGVADAAAEGDRSENAEYIYGKRRLAEIDRRLTHLADRLEKVAVVEPRPEQAGRVFFGAWVRLEDEDGEEKVYRVVGPDETEVESGRISIDSPMGKALIGREVDDDVVVRRPKGDATFSVLEIAYTPLEE